MPVESTRDLLKFLKPYSKKVQQLAMELREFVWKLYPDCNELIYDNYNAVAFGWSVSEKLGGTFCTIAAATDYVHFGFYYGNRLSDPEKKLLGDGSQYRYIKVSAMNEFPRAYIKKLLKQAHADVMAALPGREQVVKGLTITKSISEKKRRPKPN
jgi:hypothetical protein